MFKCIIEVEDINIIHYVRKGGCHDRKVDVTNEKLSEKTSLNVNNNVSHNEINKVAFECGYGD